ncbi:hypothetical protein G9A89_008001 [Geosiphon pyriformis]|nr:hypothetical protein G9A89_008001 [Geosiphon pyriformis]
MTCRFCARRLVYLLSFSVRIYVSSFNNFLVGIICILLNCGLSLDDFLANFFWFYGGVSMSAVLVSNGAGSLNILESSDFVFVCDCLLQVGADSLSVYTDGSLSNLGTVGCRTGTTVFFKDIDLSLDVSVLGLISFTLAELQAIVLALECVSLLSSVKLFSDSQSALDVCKSELGLVCSDFCNQYWVERYHIVNVIYNKNLKISWHKVKSHFGILGNKCANMIAGDASLSGWYFSHYLDEKFIVVDSSVAGSEIVKFVCSLSLNFRSDVWLVHAKHCAYMEKNGLIPLDGLVLVSVSGLVSELLAGVIKLLSISNLVLVYIVA